MPNYYYSGQGSLYMAERDTVTGKAKGFLPIGNVPELSIEIAVTKTEHKESESGNRLLDATIINEKKGTFKFKLENLSIENLALGLFGTSNAVVGASVTNEEFVAYLGKRSSLANPKVSAVVVRSKQGAGAAARGNTTAYALNALYVPASANGRYYKCTVSGTSAAAPPTFTTNGTTFADGTATFLDMGLIIKSATTDYSVDANNGVITSLSTGTIAVGETLSVDYTFAAYSNMEAFTSAAAPERWLRFEGLNTMDNSLVIIDAYRAQFDPMTNYALLGDAITGVDMGGSLLSDAFVTSGSKFFRQRNIAA